MKRDKFDIKKIKSELPHDSYKLIAAEANVSIETVTKVLNGTRKNIKVIEIAVRIANEEKKRLISIAKMADAV